MRCFERVPTKPITALVHEGASTHVKSARLVISRRRFNERVRPDCRANQIIELILESILVKKA